MTRKKSSKKRNDTNNISTSNNDIATKSTGHSGSGIHSGAGHIKGLFNLGNTCYFNSMLQMILHSPQFMRDLKTYCSADYEMIVKTPTGPVTLVLKQTEVSCVERELIKISESAGGSVSPAGLRNALLKNDQFRAHFHGFNEQDSHEAFLMTLNTVRDGQVRRIRKAVLDHYRCDRYGLAAAALESGGVAAAGISEETRADIRTLGSLADKHTPVQAHFGLAVASALRCGSCGDLRLRFDECLHLAPPLESLPDSDQAPSGSRANRLRSPPTVSGQELQHNEGTEGGGGDNSSSGGQRNKLSKHQQKKQKRIERKAKRVRKASARNAECSFEHEDRPISVALETDPNRVDTDSAYDTLSVDIEPQDAPGAALGDQSESIIDEMAARFADTVSLDNGLVIDDDDANGEQKQAESPIAITDDDDDESTTFHCTDESSAINNDESAITDHNDASAITDHNDESAITDHNDESAIIDHNDESTITDHNDASAITDHNDESTITGNGELSSITPCNIKSTIINDTPKNTITDTNNPPAITDPCVQTRMNGHQRTRNHSNCDNHTERPVDAQATQKLFRAVIDTHSDHLGDARYHMSTHAGPQTDLERALAQFVAPLSLEGLACDACSRGTNAPRPHTKMDRVVHAPPVLPIYISRFKQVSAGKRGSAKNSQFYSYPFVLDLSGQCSQLANVPAKRGSPVLYRLFGIIEHLGARINSGHYVSYVSQRRPTMVTDEGTDTASDIDADTAIAADMERDRRSPDWLATLWARFEQRRRRSPSPDWGDSGDDVALNCTPSGCSGSDYDWYRISDSHVEPVSLGAAMSCQAFMLFYSRIQ